MKQGGIILWECLSLACMGYNWEWLEIYWGKLWVFWRIKTNFNLFNSEGFLPERILSQLKKRESSCQNKKPEKWQDYFLPTAKTCHSACLRPAGKKGHLSAGQDSPSAMKDTKRKSSCSRCFISLLWLTERIRRFILSMALKCSSPLPYMQLHINARSLFMCFYSYVMQMKTPAHRKLSVHGNVSLSLLL